MPALLARSGPLAGRRFELEHPEVILGRENAAITLADDETSRRHAAIRVIAGSVVIEDLGSTNGTFVDGRRIETATQLVGGETIRLGRTTFVVEVEAAPAPAPGATRVAGRRDLARTQPRQRPPVRRREPRLPDDPGAVARPRPPVPDVAAASAAAARPATVAVQPVPDVAAASAAAARPATVAVQPVPAAAPPPFEAVSLPRARRRRVASRKLGPTLASFATITSTAVALVVYFAGR